MSRFIQATRRTLIQATSRPNITHAARQQRNAISALASAMFLAPVTARSNLSTATSSSSSAPRLTITQVFNLSSQSTFSGDVTTVPESFNESSALTTLTSSSSGIPPLSGPRGLCSLVASDEGEDGS